MSFCYSGLRTDALIWSHSTSLTRRHVREKQEHACIYSHTKKHDANANTTPTEIPPHVHGGMSRSRTYTTPTRQWTRCTIFWSSTSQWNTCKLSECYTHHFAVTETTRGKWRTGVKCQSHNRCWKHLMVKKKKNSSKRQTSRCWDLWFFSFRHLKFFTDKSNFKFPSHLYFFFYDWRVFAKVNTSAASAFWMFPSSHLSPTNESPGWTVQQ